MTRDFHNSNKSGKTIKKSITIRGIDADIYENFTTEIKNFDMNIGEAVTKMMSGVIDNIGEDISKSASASLKNNLKSILVSDQNRLVVTKNDLTEVDNAFNFLHIQTLKFDPDVDIDTFMNKVLVIRACNKVILPNYGLPRLVLLSKFKFCDDIEIYDI